MPVEVTPDTPPDDPRWLWHDFRCMGECPNCWGANACSLVGHTCQPCPGCLPEDGPLTAQRFPA